MNALFADTPMDTFVNAVSTSINDGALWGVIQSTIPFLAVAVMFALGYGIVRRLTKGVSKGKVS